jgi:hypothetical protein
VIWFVFFIEHDKHETADSKLRHLLHLIFAPSIGRFTIEASDNPLVIA